MWDAIKNVVMTVQDALGIEVPELPVDLGSVGESVTGAVQGVTESATGAVESVTASGEAALGQVSGVTEQVSGVTEQVSGIPGAIVDSATGAVPGAEVLREGFRR